MLRAAVLVFLPACGSGAEQTPSAPRTEIDADRDGVPAPEDCADGDADIHPGAEERCNGLDDDCDGDIDEDAVDSTAWYPDLDRDGYGADEGAVMACRPPEAGIARGGDCDDTTSTVNPARVETCNGRDDDCDGEIDEVGAVGETTWHADGDGDGFGTPATAVEACTAPAGHVRDATDCDDNRPDAHPGADEVCGNGTLEDCNLGPGDALSLCGPGGEGTVATALMSLDGARPGDRAGARVGPGGDLDGDGTIDLLIGGSPADTGSAGAGGVWVVSGTTNGVHTLDIASFAEIHGTRPGEAVGAAFSGPGDLDGDGQDDLIVSGTGGGDGRVSAFLGPLGGTLYTDASAWVTWRLPTDSGAGTALATGGFGAGGGVAMALGAPETTAGGVHLIPSIAASPTDLTTLPFLTGERPGGRVGDDLVNAGDVDGDGIADLLVGALTDDRGAPNGGAAFLLLGPLTMGGSIEDSQCILRGTRTGAALGGGLGAPGDVDGDGHEDLLIGAYADSTVEIGAGAAYLFHGPLTGTLGTNDAHAVLLGQYRGDGLGQEIAGPGDINGDGTPDLLLGTPAADRAGPASGAAFVFLGPISGTRSAASAEAVLTGIGSGARVGAAVAFIPDLGGDGADELLVGGPTVSPAGRAGAGAAYLIAGGGP